MNVLHTQTFGQGPPLVMLHGWAMHSGIWQEFAVRLAQDFQVICIDLPGHGSSATLESCTLEGMSKQILAAVPERPCHWLGWSLGATLALHIAAGHAGRVLSVTMLAGNPCFTQRTNWSGMPVSLLQSFMSAMHEQADRTLIRFLSLQLQGEVRAKALLKQTRQHLFERKQADVEVLESALDILISCDLRPALASLQCPVLGIFGELDAFVPLQVSRDLSTLSSAVSVQVVDNAGHMPFLNNEQKVSQLISDFIAA